ncbi:MAG: hypothetical protein Q9162_000471 [Coniocarpon cinnabarinum]
MLMSLVTLLPVELKMKIITKYVQRKIDEHASLAEHLICKGYMSDSLRRRKVEIAPEAESVKRLIETALMNKRCLALVSSAVQRRLEILTDLEARTEQRLHYIAEHGHLPAASGAGNDDLPREHDQLFAVFWKNQAEHTCLCQIKLNLGQQADQPRQGSTHRDVDDARASSHAA